MEHVLKESEQQPFDTVQKYHKYLDDFKEIDEQTTTTRTHITTELDLLKDKRISIFQELEQLFNDMQDREKEIGYVIITIGRD